jgi:hypothetical protein
MTSQEGTSTDMPLEVVDESAFECCQVCSRWPVKAEAEADIASHQAVVYAREYHLLCVWISKEHHRRQLRNSGGAISEIRDS